MPRRRAPSSCRHSPPRASAAPRLAAVSGLVAVSVSIGCSSPPAGPRPESSTAPPPAAATFVAGSDATASPFAGAPAAVPAAPSASTGAPPAAAPGPAVPSAAPSAAVAAPPAGAPRGKVSNIGMHIGGGPNDDATKEPIRKSVQPHFEAFRQCYGLAKEAKPADFGVDLHIPREGGKASLKNPRSTLKDEPFKTCVIGVFDAIVFLKPRTGETIVSYSLRFTP